MAWLSKSELGKEYISISKPKKVINEHKVGDDDYEVIDWSSPDLIEIPSGTIEFMTGMDVFYDYPIFINFNR